MKYLLSTSALACCFSLAPFPQYRLTCLYLLLTIPASLSFRVESGWLHAWYPLLVGPVAVLRVMAGIEILHRQTEGFRFWWRLTGCAFVVAGMFAGMGWVQSPHPDVLQSFVEFRRLMQIWLAGVFVYVECFWLTQGGGWYRRADHFAALFAVLALNHGAVSFLGGALGWSEATWSRASWWSWLIDSGVYLAMALRCRVAPSVRLYPATWR